MALQASVYKLDAVSACLRLEHALKRRGEPEWNAELGVSAWPVALRAEPEHPLAGVAYFSTIRQATGDKGYFVDHYEFNPTVPQLGGILLRYGLGFHPDAPSQARLTRHSAVVPITRADEAERLTALPDIELEDYEASKRLETITELFTLCTLEQQLYGAEKVSEPPEATAQAMHAVAKRMLGTMGS